MRICMLLHKSVAKDSRVRREAKALAAAGHEVTVVHLPAERHAAPFQLDGFRVVCATPRTWIRRLLPLRAYRVAFLAGFVRGARRARPDVVHAHDAPMLAPALVATRLTRARLVYDSHELATGVPYRERLWARLVATLERIALPRVAAVVTVSDGIANRLQELYELPGRPVVLRNIPDLNGSVDGVAGMRERLGIGSAPLVLHQGALAPGRGCERLVQGIAELPGVHLVFLGDAWPSYRGVVERIAAEADARDRVHFLPSVPLDELLAYTREADVGVSLLSDDCENHRLALPNKVFEYIAAGVPVVASDLPELRRLVAAYRVGRTVDASDPAALAEALTATLADREVLREPLRGAAAELSWEREAERLIDLYHNLIGKQPRRALVFVRNPVTYDARVLREGRLLQEMDYETTIVGSVSSSEPVRETMISGIHVVRLAPGSLPWRRRHTGKPAEPAPIAPVSNGGSPQRPPASAGRRLLLALDWYRRGIAHVMRTRPTLVHCNDYNTMWIGVAARLAGARVIYDSHELWPDRNLRPEPRWWLMMCETLFARIADQVITTSPAYASVLSRRYRIPEPLVVRNVPDAPASPPTRVEQSVGAGTAVYIGAVTPGRGLEIAVRALTRLPTLRLRIVGPDMRGYSRRLLEVAREAGVLERVELCPPVPPERVVREAARADLGLALIEPACLSYTLTLPNKLFEYMAAGVPVVASRLPAIQQVLDSTGAGATADPLDEREVADRIAGVLDPTENQRMRAAARAAAAKFTWASESATLASVYRAA